MPSQIAYVLDTNVLLHSPEVLNAYPQAEIVIPIDVIEEIDQFKSTLSETGNSARTVSKMLDEYRIYGNLSEGITLPNQGQLRIEFSLHPKADELHGLDWSKSSNRVLSVALKLKEAGRDAVIVTLDTHLRVKGNAFGIQVMPYQGEQKEVVFYQGIHYETAPEENLQRFREQETFQLDGRFSPHEGLVLINQEDEEDYHAGVFDAEQNQFVSADHKAGIWGIVPRNAEQHVAMDLLLNPEIPIVTLVGRAGTGKTLLALASGLEMMLIENQYSRLLVSRPIFPMGRDLGYLPGDVQEKLAPWMQPIFDNLELLLSSSDSAKNTTTKGHQELVEQGMLTIEPLTYIRGRSIPHQYMIVDEAQNLTPHEVKTIITRVGEGTKIVLTGDPDQIDNPYVNKASNGLSYIVEKFKNQRVGGHVTLKRGERSELAELAANIL
ncbi:MAG: PhoH family protein [SAR324 cluster bacterium]|nr:PhoH family protein [SAR324 cluster bacterium]